MCAKTHVATGHGAVQDFRLGNSRGWSLFPAACGDDCGCKPVHENKNDNVAAARVKCDRECDPDALRASASATPSLKEREEIFAVLEREGLVDGVEIGVQRGYFAKAALGTWTKARRYALVDVWGEQDNYVDQANVAQSLQDQFYVQAKAAVKFRSNDTRIEICRNFTTVKTPEDPRT